MSRTTHLGCCRVGVPEAAPLAAAIRRPHCTRSVRFQSQGSSEPLAPSRRVSGERASPVSASPPRPRAGRWGTGLHWRSSRPWRFPLHGAPLKRAAPVTVRPLESCPAGRACSQRGARKPSKPAGRAHVLAQTEISPEFEARSHTRSRRVSVGRSWARLPWGRSAEWAQVETG